MQDAGLDNQAFREAPLWACEFRRLFASHKSASGSAGVKLQVALQRVVVAPSKLIQQRSKEQRAAAEARKLEVEERMQQQAEVRAQLAQEEVDAARSKAEREEVKAAEARKAKNAILLLDSEGLACGECPLSLCCC